METLLKKHASYFTREKSSRATNLSKSVKDLNFNLYLILSLLYIILAHPLVSAVWLSEFFNLFFCTVVGSIQICKILLWNVVNAENCLRPIYTDTYVTFLISAFQNVPDNDKASTSLKKPLLNEINNSIFTHTIVFSVIFGHSQLFECCFLVRIQNRLLYCK